MITTAPPGVDRTPHTALPDVTSEQPDAPRVTLRFSADHDPAMVAGTVDQHGPIAQALVGADTQWTWRHSSRDGVQLVLPDTDCRLFGTAAQVPPTFYRSVTDQLADAVRRLTRSGFLVGFEVGELPAPVIRDMREAFHAAGANTGGVDDTALIQAAGEAAIAAERRLANEGYRHENQHGANPAAAIDHERRVATTDADTDAISAALVLASLADQVHMHRQQAAATALRQYVDVAYSGLPAGVAAAAEDLHSRARALDTIAALRDRGDWRETQGIVPRNGKQPEGVTPRVAANMLVAAARTALEPQVAHFIRYPGPAIEYGRVRVRMWADEHGLRADLLTDTDKGNADKLGAGVSVPIGSALLERRDAGKLLRTMIADVVDSAAARADALRSDLAALLAQTQPAAGTSDNAVQPSLADFQTMAATYGLATRSTSIEDRTYLTLHEPATPDHAVLCYVVGQHGHVFDGAGRPLPAAHAAGYLDAYRSAVNPDWFTTTEPPPWLTTLAPHTVPGPFRAREIDLATLLTYQPNPRGLSPVADVACATLSPDREHFLIHALGGLSARSGDTAPADYLEQHAGTALTASDKRWLDNYLSEHPDLVTRLGHPDYGRRPHIAIRPLQPPQRPGSESDRDDRAAVAEPGESTTATPQLDDGGLFDAAFALAAGSVVNPDVDGADPVDGSGPADDTAPDADLIPDSDDGMLGLGIVDEDGQPEGDRARLEDWRGQRPHHLIASRLKHQIQRQGQAARSQPSHHLGHAAIAAWRAFTDQLGAAAQPPPADLIPARPIDTEFPVRKSYRRIKLYGERGWPPPGPANSHPAPLTEADIALMVLRLGMAYTPNLEGLVTMVANPDAGERSGHRSWVSQRGAGYPDAGQTDRVVPWGTGTYTSDAIASGASFVEFEVGRLRAGAVRGRELAAWLAPGVTDEHIEFFIEALEAWKGYYGRVDLLVLSEVDQRNGEELLRLIDTVLVDALTGCLRVHRGEAAPEAAGEAMSLVARAREHVATLAQAVPSPETVRSDPERGFGDDPPSWAPPPKQPWPRLDLHTAEDIVAYVLGDHPTDEHLRTAVERMVCLHFDGDMAEAAATVRATGDAELYRRAETAAGPFMGVDERRAALERLAGGDRRLPWNSIGERVELKHHYWPHPGPMTRDDDPPINGIVLDTRRISDVHVAVIVEIDPEPACGPLLAWARVRGDGVLRPAVAAPQSPGNATDDRSHGPQPADDIDIDLIAQQVAALSLNSRLVYVAAEEYQAGHPRIARRLFDSTLRDLFSSTDTERPQAYDLDPASLDLLFTCFMGHATGAPADPQQLAQQHIDAGAGLRTGVTAWRLGRRLASDAERPSWRDDHYDLIGADLQAIGERIALHAGSAPLSDNAAVDSPVVVDGADSEALSAVESDHLAFPSTPPVTAEGSGSDQAAAAAAAALAPPGTPPRPSAPDSVPQLPEMTSREQVVTYVLGPHSLDRDLRAVASVVISGRGRKGLYPADAQPRLQAVDPDVYWRALTATVGNTKRGQAWDVSRARAALQRLAAGDPTLPATSLGHPIQVTETDPTVDTVPLAGPAPTRTVTGRVVAVEPSRRDYVRVIVERDDPGPDDPPRASMECRPDATLTVVADSTAQPAIDEPDSVEPYATAAPVPKDGEPTTISPASPTPETEDSLQELVDAITADHPAVQHVRDALAGAAEIPELATDTGRDIVAITALHDYIDEPAGSISSELRDHRRDLPLPLAGSRWLDLQEATRWPQWALSLHQAGRILRLAGQDHLAAYADTVATMMDDRLRRLEHTSADEIVHTGGIALPLVPVDHPAAPDLLTQLRRARSNHWCDERFHTSAGLRIATETLAAHSQGTLEDTIAGYEADRHGVASAPEALAELRAIADTIDAAGYRQIPGAPGQTARELLYAVADRLTLRLTREVFVYKPKPAVNAVRTTPRDPYPGESPDLMVRATAESARLAAIIDEDTSVAADTLAHAVQSVSDTLDHADADGIRLAAQASRAGDLELARAHLSWAIIKDIGWRGSTEAHEIVTTLLWQDSGDRDPREWPRQLLRSADVSGPRITAHLVAWAAMLRHRPGRGDDLGELLAAVRIDDIADQVDAIAAAFAAYDGHALPQPPPLPEDSLFDVAPAVQRPRTRREARDTRQPASATPRQGNAPQDNAAPAPDSGAAPSAAGTTTPLSLQQHPDGLPVPETIWPSLHTLRAMAEPFDLTVRVVRVDDQVFATIGEPGAPRPAVLCLPWHGTEALDGANRPVPADQLLDYLTAYRSTVSPESFTRRPG